jgi:hypothetical protein
MEIKDSDRKRIALVVLEAMIDSRVSKVEDERARHDIRVKNGQPHDLLDWTTAETEREIAMLQIVSATLRLVETHPYEPGQS